MTADKSKKVLIVEDSATQAAVMANIVVSMGMQPVVTSDLSRGISQIINQENPDIVILDLILIDQSTGKQLADGFQLCREIKRLKADLPVIVVTAEEDDDAWNFAPPYPKEHSSFRLPTPDPSRTPNPPSLSSKSGAGLTTA